MLRQVEAVVVGAVLNRAGGRRWGYDAYGYRYGYRYGYGYVYGRPAASAGRRRPRGRTGARAAATPTPSRSRPARRPATTSGSVRAYRAPMALTLSLASPALDVEPGSFVRTDVVVGNDGPAPVTARVAVTGPAGPLSWVVPPDIDVAPRSTATVSVGFRVPRSPDQAAGPLAFDVVVTPAGGAAPGVSAAGTVTVAPFRDVLVELDPPDAGSADHQVVLENRGNVVVAASLHPSADGGVDVAVASATVEVLPGQRLRVPVRVRPGRGAMLRSRTASFAVAVDTGAEPVRLTGTVEQPARRPPAAAAVALALAVVLVAVGLRLGVLAPDDGSTAVSARGAGTAAPSTTVRAREACPAANHADTRANGLHPEDIPTLPADFSFQQVAADGCSPVRWNPCEPIHFVVNPAGATTTGVADVREAFHRLEVATGLSFVDDGFIDEVPQGNRAYQPDRYPGRWAPIIVHWTTTNRSQGDVQVVGGGIPTRVGDAYVTANLFLNPQAVIDARTREPVPGGFADQPTIGPIGAQGVTWGRVILHELAHITGLGHVRDTSQLMYPETTEQTGTTAFQNGDMAGLRYLGKDAGCLATPAPGPVPTRGP